MHVPTSLSDRVASARVRIADAAQRAGKSPDDVLLVAVTKTLPAEVVAEAYALGLRTFGENRVQEGSAKRATLAVGDAQWELIGHLQTNKVAVALASFDRVQSVDSLRLAEAMSRRGAATGGRDIRVLLEVNVAGEATKTGFAAEELLRMAEQIVALPHLRVEGLMTVAPLVAHAEETRPVFAALRALRDALRREVPVEDDGGWHELSMGMSDDFEVAIEEGATIVRLGRILFGERPPTAP